MSPSTTRLEASSAPFIRQFDSRPNYLYVEYLAYPREVLATVSGMHLWLLIGVTLVALAAAEAKRVAQERAARLEEKIRDLTEVDDDNGGLRLPDGFCAKVFADDGSVAGSWLE